MLNELVRAPLADLDAAVTDVIGRLSGVCGASWACIFRLDAGTMVKTHEYCADGVDPLPCDPEHMLAPWRERLNQNLPVLVPDSRALDADTPPAQLTAARAFLVLPIMADGHLADGETAMLDSLTHAWRKMPDRHRNSEGALP